MGASSFVQDFRLWYYSKPPALRSLIAVNVVLYVLWQFLRFSDTIALFFYQYLTLHPQLPDILWHPWQFVTYSFLHLGTGLSGFLHILFNMLWLYWMGYDYERLYGSHRLLALYVLAAIGGGVLTVVLHTLFPGVPNFGGPVYGASASVIGVLVAQATLHPRRGIGLLFIGVVPLKWLAIGFLVLDALLGFGSNVSLSAHWGGALVGYWFVQLERKGVDLSSWAQWFMGRPSRRRISVMARLEHMLSRKEQSTSGTSLTASNMQGEDIDEREIDRILDKISAYGYDALTEEEKEKLYRASSR